MISILVPVYNVERYLQRCIDSVLSQEYKDWELILVDDGSTDCSGAICNVNHNLNPNKIKVIHTENGGLPSARLAGFREAKGEYLIFLDADDWLLPGALQTLYDAITSDGGHDVVRSVVKRVTEDGHEWEEHYDIESGTIEGTDAYARTMRSDRMSPYLHSAIYRSDLFDEKVFQPIIVNKVSVGEDWFTNYAISPKVNRLKFIDTPTFSYFVNPGSMMGGSIYGWNYLERLERCAHQINENIEFAEDDGYRANRALGNLKYFFVPEIPFRWKLFKTWQPWIIKGIEQRDKWYNPHYAKFIHCAPMFYLYANCYKFLFFIFKLKGKRRRVLE